MSTAGRATWRRRLAAARESMDSRLWPVPLVAVVGAVVVGILLPLIDRAVDEQLPDAVRSLVFGGESDAARAVLSAISGSLITAASLTFSLTVVALQLATNQGSPRLLRLFASDRMVHATLALFLGTFAFAITVLRTVEDATEDAAAFVPRISVTVASVMTLASVILLTFFLAHLARQLRVETMMRDVHREASATIALMADDGLPSASQAPARPDHPHVVRAPASGFLTSVDRGRLVEIAVAEDVVLAELRPIGSNVVEGTPLVEVWSHGERPEGLDERISAAFGSAYERTSTQDIGFGLRQLADIAVKALSPGVNDPTTAVHAIGHLAALLGDLAQKDDPPAAYADDDGRPRLIPAGDAFASLVDVALTGIRRYGAGDADAAMRLFGLVDDVAWRIRSSAQAAVLHDQLARLERSVAAADYDDAERAAFTAAAARARATLARA